MSLALLRRSLSIRPLALASGLIAGAAPACNAPDGTSPESAPTSATPEPRVSFACDPTTDVVPERLRRLTMTQYRNTVRDLVRWAVQSDEEASAILGEAPLAELPEDRREPVPADPHGSYRRLDQALDQAHVDATYHVGAAIGRALTQPARLAAIAGECATDADPTNDAACRTGFILRFGARALRHPLSPDEVDFYASVYDADGTSPESAYATLITVLLNAPHFLYFVEPATDEVPGKPGMYALSAHELASRLSYHFWQTLPDDALWQSAEDGSLLEPSVYAAQVDRLLGDTRARETLTSFFEDWLKLEELPILDSLASDPAYRSFAGADIPTPMLRPHMVDEVRSLTQFVTWTLRGGMRELLTTEVSVSPFEDLANIYGVVPWDGVSAPPTLPPGERPGLLTRALFLARGSLETHPIRRGVFIRRQILCDDLPPPPANVAALLADRQLSQTTRQVVSALTEQPGTACAGCHATLINPLGFAFEGFDALGRVRSEQRFFDAAGGLIGAQQVDTRTIPRVTPADDRSSSGPADLARFILDSGKAEACMARQYFRFAAGRWEDPTRDGCTLERLRSRLVASGQLAEMLREIAFTPEFLQKSLPYETQAP